MGHPGVGQAAMLAAELARSVDRWRPRGLLLPGCATGQGLECLHGLRLERITAVDLQEEYLALLRRRHAAALPMLEVVRADLEQWQPDEAAYDLVHCALILEYLRPAPFVARMARALAPGGVAFFLLQLPSVGHATVSETPFHELKALAYALRLVSPEELRAAARDAGLRLEEEEDFRLASGKGFARLAFRR